MCIYCDRYVKDIDDPDLYYIDQERITVMDNLLAIDKDVYITEDHENHKPVLMFVTSYWCDGCGPYNETIKKLYITNCPFCGVELESARKGFEETYKEENK